MFNLNEKYFSISERCGRNHQNKFCLCLLKWTNVPGELNSQNSRYRNEVADFIHSLPIHLADTDCRFWLCIRYWKHIVRPKFKIDLIWISFFITVAPKYFSLRGYGEMSQKVIKWDIIFWAISISRAYDFTWLFEPSHLTPCICQLWWKDLSFWFSFLESWQFLWKSSRIKIHL